MIGFIGAGNMGRALIQSLFLLKNKKIRREKVYVFDYNTHIRKYLPKNSSLKWTNSPTEVFHNCSIVFLCIKPKDVNDFFIHQGKNLKRHHILISIIAGLTIASLRKTASLPHLKVCRIMPNLAAGIGKSTGTVTYSGNISPTEKKSLQKILQYSGLYLETSESLVNAVTSVSGCGPAFVFLFIEALSQAMVSLKVPRKKALLFATETLIGASSLLKSSQVEPLKLTKQVTSPGGMTIEGVNHLNNSDFQKLVIEAVHQAHAKAKLLFK